MKKIIFTVLLAATVLGGTSCKKDPTLPTPSVEDFPQIYTNISTQSSYKVTDAQGTTNPMATFNMELRGGNLNDVESIQIYRTFRGFNVPATGNPVLALGGPTLLLRSVPPVSGNIDISLNDIIAGLTRPTGATQAGNRTAITRASLRATEGFLLTYDLLLKNGRRIEYNQSFNNAPFSGNITIVP